MEVSRRVPQNWGALRMLNVEQHFYTPTKLNTPTS